MKIAIVGCGYVFDIYMRTRWAHPELEIAGVFDIDAPRLEAVCRHYRLTAYPDYAALLDDASVEVVVNLTSIGSHRQTIERALNAGKHVYSEKPLTTDLDETKALFELARVRQRILTGAPCNLYSDAVVSVWKALRDNAIGRPVLIYAELDDNPAHLMQLDKVQSPTGAPFPYAEELQEGCTVEHVAYHLVWLCAMFGPALSVTAFSKFLVPDKMKMALTPPDTPDFSVACLEFSNGVAARITCTWVSPRDHRFRIIGDAGEISVDNIFHDHSAVHIERFSKVGLSTRKLYSLRRHPLLGRFFGIGGRRVPLVRRWKSHGVEAERGVGRSFKHRLVSWLRYREVYAQDKLLGIAEMARAMKEGREQPMRPDFLMHLNELTLMIQRAGPAGIATKPVTSFAPVAVMDTTAGAPDYRQQYRAPMFERLFAGVVAAMHRR